MTAPLFDGADHEDARWIDAEGLGERAHDVAAGEPDVPQAPVVELQERTYVAPMHGDASRRHEPGSDEPG